MFALDARSVLLKPDVSFSDRNMQLAAATRGDTEEYFQKIDFVKVYSEGYTGGDRTYTDARCAEVMLANPLHLKDCLRAIYLRSEPERDTLYQLLGDAREEWAPYCQVSDNLKVFQKEYTFVQTLRISDKGVVFRLNPRKDRHKIKIKINIYDVFGGLVDSFINEAHDAHPSPPYDNWIWERGLDDGSYLVEVYLEDHLACKSWLQLGDALF